MLAVAGGDVSRLSALFDRHHRALFNFFVKMTGNRAASEDLVQDVFFRILKYRHTYRPGIPFDRWMYRIAVNARNDQARKHRGEKPWDDDAEAQVGTEPLPSEALLRAQELVLLKRALARLTDDKREVLVLSRFQNLKHEEIAEILGVNVGAVRVRVYRALQELKGVFFGLSGERKNEV